MLILSREWQEACVGSKTQKDSKKARKANLEGDYSFPATARAARRLTIAACSSLLARLDLHMNALGFDTLVEEMEGYRSAGHSIQWLIDMVKLSEEPTPRTRSDMLKYVDYGSPKFRYILRQMRDYVLQSQAGMKPRKLLITEDTPLVAWFYELVLQFLHIPTAVLHAGLDDYERQNLIDKFREKSSDLMVLIIMYSVSAQGVNLDSCCCRVLVATAAINAALEIQAWGRVMRVSNPAYTAFQTCLKVADLRH